jgi:exonuclease SbcD
VLLIADTHLGFDLPFRPKIERRRRGHDFFANFNLALQPALNGEVDLVVHGGDLLYRSKVPPALVDMALEPLIRVARAGVPVYLVPGNHERSRIPLQLWGQHPNLYIFDQPRTYLYSNPQATIALSGFPFTRGVRSVFREQVAATNYGDTNADFRLLCIHEAVEGAQVGPSDFTFRYGQDVVEAAQIPPHFSAVLSGHIHRSQMLTHSLKGELMPAPVIYPGSVERTSFAERFEEKHYVLLKFGDQGNLEETSFVRLPARSMVFLVIQSSGYSHDDLEHEIEMRLKEIDPDSVVRIQLQGLLDERMISMFGAATLRRLAPPSMNISLRVEPRPRVPSQ